MTDAATPTTTTAEPCGAGDVIAGRYEIEKRLGRGGMGSVYLAHDLQTDESLALKYFPRESLDDTGLEQVRNEFLSLAQMDHPNLMGTREFGYDPATDGYFLTLEHIAGSDLLSALRDTKAERKKDRVQLLSIFCQLLRGLGFIHDLGLVYGDVKPHNILVDTTESDAPRVKIIDFGIISRERGRHGDRIWGTPSYVAPEMIRGAAYDRRVDLYAVGVMLYRVLTGELPFTGTSNLEIMKGHLERPPVAPSKKKSKLPSEFDDVVLRLLEKQPENRYQNAPEVIDDINRRFDLSQPLENFETARSHLVVGELAARREESDRLLRILSACCLQPVDERVTDEFDDDDEDAAALPDSRLDNIVPSGHAILLQGSDGTGINRLVERLRCQAQADQVCVIDCACGGEHALEEIDRMLDHVQALSARAEQTAGMDAVVSLQRLLRRGTEGLTDESWEECKTSLALVVLTLIELSRTFPILLVFRDAHESGPLHLELIRSFVQASSTHTDRENRALLVTTTDPLAGVDNGNCRTLLEAPSFQRHATCITLEPLDESQTRRLITAAFKSAECPPEFAEILTRESEGHIRETSRILSYFLRQNFIERTTEGWSLDEACAHRDDIGPVRQDVDDLVQSLPTRAHRLAVAFAVVDDASQEDLVCALADIPEGEYPSLVAVLERQKLVRAKPLSASYHGYVLANRSVRSSLRNGIDGAEWAALNEAAGTLLETKRDDGERVRVERLAHHFIAAENQDKGQQYGLELARDRERQLDLNGALAAYLEVHELIDSHVTDNARTVAKGIARLRLEVGDFRGVTRIARFFDGETRSHDAPRPVGILLSAARAQCRLGEFENAYETLREVESLLTRDVPTERRIDYLLAVAELHYMRDDHVESLRYCEAAEAELGPHVDAQLSAAVCLLLSKNYAAMSVVVDAARYCQRALRFLDLIKGGSSLAESFLTRGAYYDHRCQYSRALKQLNLGLLLLRQSNAFAGAAECMLAIGRIHRRLGNLHESRKFLEASLSVFRKIDARPRVVETECELAHVMRLMGHGDTAHRLLGAAIEDATDLDKPSVLCEALFGLACHQYDHGQFRDGDEHLNRIARISRRTALSVHTLRVALVRSDVALLCGDLKSALDRARNAVLDARELRDPLLVAAALRRQAFLQLRLDNVADARRHLAALLDLSRRQHLPLEEGWGRLLDAIALVTEDKPELARRSFDTAREIMAECGGPRDLLELYLHRGMYFLDQGLLEDAYVDLEEGLYLARSQDLPHATSRYLIARGLLEATLPSGSRSRVEEYLRSATEYANRGPFPEPLWQAQRSLSQLLERAGREAEAEVASLVADQQLDVLLANTPVGQRRAIEERSLFSEFEVASAGEPTQ